MADLAGSVHDRFYRCLVVQHILQHIRRHALSNAFISRSRPKTKGPHLKKEKNYWHSFLDSLSILCDHRTGGETVTSVAAECDSEIKGRTTFWILVNGQQPTSLTSLRAKEHLDSLIGRLHHTARSGQVEEQLMLESFHDSVYKAKDKVNNYRKKLQGRILDLKDRAGGLSSEENLLIEAIDTLIDENKTVGALCEKAYEFRSTDNARKLARRARKDPTDQWKDVCHFIGRLGAWLKATRFLFEHASRFDILSNYEVEIVPIEECTSFSTPPPMWELEELLLQTLPPQFDVSKARLEYLFGQGAFAVADSLLKRCEANGWRLKTHAESSMAHFFFVEDRHFVNEDRYIGCSKPSCICCELYLETLSGEFARRPCHGNAWVQWRLPGPSLSTSDAAIAIMQQMADRLQRDIEIELISAAKGHVFTHDSSTNMSSVFGRLSMRHQ